MRAMIFGRMLTALIQGALGGMMFWILGLEAALVWSVVMMVLSLIPAIGSAFVWAPRRLGWRFPDTGPKPSS